MGVTAVHVWSYTRAVLTVSVVPTGEDAGEAAERGQAIS